MKLTKYTVCLCIKGISEKKLVKELNSYEKPYEYEVEEDIIYIYTNDEEEGMVLADKLLVLEADSRIGVGISHMFNKMGFLSICKQLAENALSECRTSEKRIIIY